jgi:hypothetical protein
MHFWKRLSRAFTGPPSPGWRPPIRAVGFGAALLVGLLFQPSSARATLLLQDDPNSHQGSPLGHFTGSLTYTKTNANSGTLVLTLTNTSALSTGYYLTAFAFDNPNNKITGVTYSSTDSNFNLIGSASVNGGIKVTPFGTADLGASSDPGAQQPWEGAGSPNNGLAVGKSATFTFKFTGTGVGDLTEKDFVTALTDSPEGGGSVFLPVRFRGGQGSDKVGAVVVPEPASLVVGLSGLIPFGLVAVARLRRRAPPSPDHP